MKTSRKTWLLAAAATAALLAIAPAQADEPRGPGPGYGPGMMGGGYGPGYGQGYGPGMMGGGGMMMGGPGMMGGYGRGMMGMGHLYALNLSNEQLGKINQIQDEVRKKNWGLMGKLQDEQSQMRDLFLADKRDPSVIGKQAMKIADLRRQMLEASVDAHNRIEALLTKEQRDQLRNSYRRGWMMHDD